jgi:hypothetical protein
MHALLITDEYKSGETITVYHMFSTYYQKSGPYYVYAIAFDPEGHESELATFEVTITEIDNYEQISCFICDIIDRIINKFPMLEVIFGF